MKSSFIISIYKDTESLGLILESLLNQTHLPSEVIISEDGNDKNVANYINDARKKYASLNITHLMQEDRGWRKNIALNRAIVSAQHEYLIFIDGDCIPFHDFIENHINQAQKGIILAGKRVELGAHFSKLLRTKAMSAHHLQHHYWRYIPQLLQDNTKHLEEILHIPYSSILAPLLKTRVRHILGCNWSAFKEDILAINGFDESYTTPSVGEDVDLSWRFRGLGMELKTCRYNANMFHLYHKKIFNKATVASNDAIMQENIKRQTFFCKNGIIKYD